MRKDALCRASHRPGQSDLGWVIAAAIVGVVAAGCGDGAPMLGGPRAPFPLQVCPGDEGCGGSGLGVLRVGAARANINPVLVETEWVDENDDHHWEQGEDFTDVNGNGVFDAVWLGGHWAGRPATGFHSDLWVRALVLEWNDVRFGMAAVDVVGWMDDECERTRALIPESLGLDHVTISATHTHDAPDTMGLWGEADLVTGIDDDYQQLIRARIVEALTEATEELEAVTVEIAQVDTVDDTGSSEPFVGDSRDPVILDPTLTLIRFARAGRPSETVATLVHWSSHPEAAGPYNNEISSGYVGTLRDIIEQGAAANEKRGLPALAGLGGEVVFVQGMLGGQIGPGRAVPIGPDGIPIAERGLAKSDAIGTNLGRLALEALADPDAVVPIDEPALSFRTGIIDLAVENTYYHVAVLLNVFDREFYGYDTERALGEDNIPYVQSRITYVELGSIAMVTAPGEIHPELGIGGYDGSRAYGAPIISPDNPNPPNLDLAPEGPYLHDLMRANPGIEYPLVLGLAEDEIGYIVPEYNYVLHARLPYVEEAEGDHYEETNSVGPLVEEQAVGAMRRLITWHR